ncbi:MAG: hypothetical protein DMF60_10950 [Acidobacteria bacterium]|nr:MAG: hypothetical protein DMF60_10950 [Acidobacteriota bacterium]
MTIDQTATETYLDGKVKYGLSDARSFDGRECVVVGGGNSAIEAAVQLTGLDTENGITFTLNNRVTLLVRSDFTPDLKFVNKMNLYDCLDAGRIAVRFGTQIKEIREQEVILMNNKKEETDRIPNDYVFIRIGSQWPRSFLTEAGIEVLKPSELAARGSRAEGAEIS